jgi:regulatory protein
LAQREHTRAELEHKLRRYAARESAGKAGEADGAGDPVAVDFSPLLDELETKGFLSDARAAESMLGGRGQRYGSRRLKQDLQRKGVDPGLVAQTVERARQTEWERAFQLWQRKFGAPVADAAGRARQARFLAARGFPAEIILRIVRGLEPDA